jgi:DMSO/TMAO reductase YedYZ molybdopterin-dependent catalytic subunit
MTSRRAFFKELALATMAVGAASASPSWPADGPSVPGKPGMIVRSLRFFDLEMPNSGFKLWITPTSQFFVRNHMHMPVTLDDNGYRLLVGGEVATPLHLSLVDLRRLPQHSVVNTLECAGNGRAFQKPQVPGVQWGRGAVGTAGFSGPRLKDVLEKAGAKPAGKHAMFRGLDEVPGKVPPFIRSIPLEKAMHPDTLLAIQMNGAPLPRFHGYPVRALVPGWIGAASTKWLTEIKILDHEFDGNFMKPAYRMPRHPIEAGAEVKPEDTDPVTALNVKSLIASPADGATVGLRPLRLSGAAWAGEANIVRVEVSTDAGVTWNAADVSTGRAKYAWRLWAYTWKPQKRGEYVILSRATDDHGRTQPSTAFWNASGYLYNACDQVRVHVEG